MKIWPWISLVAVFLIGIAKCDVDCSSPFETCLKVGDNALIIAGLRDPVWPRVRQFLGYS